MSRKADYEIRTGAGDGATLRLTGDWSTTGIGRQGDRLSADLAGRDVGALDLAELGRFDTAGALAIARARPENKLDYVRKLKERLEQRKAEMNGGRPESSSTAGGSHA